MALFVFVSACTVTGNVVKEYNDETEVYFCPFDDCGSILAEKLKSANDINCAFYDMDLPEIAEIMKNKKARLVFDHESSIITSGSAVDPKYSQMHNKFCILDNETVLTGSMNPTKRDTSINYNNFLILHSKQLAKTYNDEFGELFNKTFSGGRETLQNSHYINNNIVNVYFCPEDWCANKILYVLNEAKSSIYFITFSFTHDQIGDLLVRKKKEGLNVAGLMEKSQNNPYAEFQKLNESGIPVKWEATGANLHHKVFIIDEKVVVTGSMNPSLNGDTKNDENLLIIYDEELSKKYVSEFERIWKIIDEK